MLTQLDRFNSDKQARSLLDSLRVQLTYESHERYILWRAAEYLEKRDRFSVGYFGSVIAYWDWTTKD